MSVGDRIFQVDVIVNKDTKVLRAYEVKRGFGHKRRPVLRDVICIQVLQKSYGKQRGLDVQKAFSHMIFYYPQPLTKGHFRSKPLGRTTSTCPNQRHDSSPQ